jgi:FAD:protein FMN transferase
VFLRETGMRISLASIAKGYAADKAKYVLQLAGVQSGVISVSGTLLTWGTQPDNEPWTIAAAAPEQSAHPLNNYNISNMCVATTVDPDKLAAVNNPYFNSRHGFPVSGIMSVSVISPTAELSNALASPIMAMGVNASLYLVNKLNQIACAIVDDHNRVYTSKGIK